jgi:hypothetical protein
MKDNKNNEIINLQKNKEESFSLIHSEGNIASYNVNSNFKNKRKQKVMLK